MFETKLKISLIMKSYELILGIDILLLQPIALLKFFSGNEIFYIL